MNPGHQQWLKRLPVLFEIPAPDPPRLLRRIGFMERDIMLPVKAAFIGMILYSFHSTRWFGLPLNMQDLITETVQFIFWFYILANVILTALLLRAKPLPLAVVQWTVVTSSLVDGLFIAVLASLSGGLDSILFWLFAALIVRNAVSVPPGFSQLFLNVAISLCYVSVGALDIFRDSNTDATLLSGFDADPDDWGQPFVLRLAVLLLMTGGCYGAQLLLERQQIAAFEAGEFAARESQLRSAGRLAAEFAHQIKNPLAIINNAAFSLQRSLRAGKAAAAAQQIEIIQEEVARADRVITQITGYAQLSEGRVEKLEVVAELDRAIAQVFPAAVPTPVKIHRDYAAHFPPLLMQRGHLSEILVNLLQNAREALGQKGNVFVNAHCRRDEAIEISVRDDGPGVPPDKIERIFEAYYTSKEKGTGLGLAIVKHNVELYGGTVRVESKSGHGAKFILLFPAKAQMKLSKS